MTNGRQRRFDTKVVHAGTGRGGALSVPISQASAFGFDTAEKASKVHEGHEPGFFYGRMGTPTQEALETAIAELEGAEAALATASGMSAIALSLLAVLKPGEHLIAQESLYTTTHALLEEFLEPYGIEVSRVDAASVDVVENAIRPTTRAIYLETPSNPVLRLADLGEIAARAKRHGIVVIVDSTFATPVNQRPLELGADLVVHSATKYLGGHGDLVAGVLVGTQETVDRARWKLMKLLGPTIAPFTAWLVLRGLKTLAVRMERHNHSAHKVAEFLNDERNVQVVHYPGLVSHPQHDLARRQMSGFGGILSFEVADAESARRVVDGVELCTRAVSLGDTATLIQHSSSMTQASLSPENRDRMGVGEGLIRLSVGLEEVDDIIQDLAQALSVL